MKYKGQQLNPLHVIALRLLAWPVVQVLRIVLCLVLLIAGGRYDAKHAWDALR